MKDMFDRLWHEELDAVFDRLDATTKARRETGCAVGEMVGQLCKLHGGGM